MKKKILIVGGSHSEIDLIRAAKDLGLYVITTGNQKKGMGHKYADEYHFADYSNLKDMLNLAKRLKIDLVCSGCNDFALISAVYIAEELNLPGFDSLQTTLTLHHKDRFRKFALENKLSSPYAKSYSISEKKLIHLDEFSFPVIVKPIDLTGGKGVKIVHDKMQLKKSIEEAFEISRAKKIVVENYFEGKQCSLSMFIKNQKVIFSFSDNEYSYLNPYLVNSSGGPAEVSNEVIESVIRETERVSKLLNLNDGLLHVQFLEKDKKYIIIELTRRCPGDLYAYPVNYATGFDYSKAIVKSSIGINLDKIVNRKQQGFYGRHCIMASQNGILKDVIINDEIRENIIKDLFWWKKGDKVKNYLVQKFGICFLKYKSMGEMKKKTSKINELINVEIKEGFENEEKN